MSSFSNRKELTFVITLGKGTFGSSGKNQVTLQGFRAKVTVDKAGGQQMGTLRAQIFGVSQSDMNAVTTLTWKPGDQILNSIQAYAIDGPQQTLIFSGWIVNAWGNYQAMPDVFLEIQANSAFAAQMTPVPPRSFDGQIDVASVMSQIAGSLGFTLENNGVNVQLNNMYLAGTGMDQAKALAEAAGIWLMLDNTVLVISPPNTPRRSQIPQIGKTSGLVSYPTFDGTGVNFQTLFNPAIIFGGSFDLVTDITRAKGQWIVTSIAHTLSTETPNGPWFSTVRGNASGIAITS